MGKIFLADVPDAKFQKIFTCASVASTADGVVASAGFVCDNDISVQRVWYQPWADTCTTGTATSSATYRRINLCNGGTAGTTTTIMASCNITASVASRGTKAFATTASNTASGGEILFFSALTVGGDDDNCSTLQSGVIQLEYELL